MTHFIDRRTNPKNRSAVNRQRFMRRFNAQIKRAVSDAVAGRSITDIEKGEKVHIPARDISEPIFTHGAGGQRELIHPGNQEFVAGDRVPRPKGQGGRGRKASNTGEDTDDFVFELSREEFLEFFFEDLELPNLIKTQLTRHPSYTTARAGFTSDGSPNNLNVVRSMKNALGRRIALRVPYARRVEEAEQRLAELRAVSEDTDPQVLALEEEIRGLRARMNAVPFLDTLDLKFNYRIKQPTPSTQAVMFCLMDVSGSMDQERKDLAKRFFILLYLFLKRTYKTIDVVFIRHHTIAKEVDEQEFFYARESGGTVVSSALRLMDEVIRSRYPTTDWNIYAAQASDGDNWEDDSPLCRDLLLNNIMPYLQYYAYIEIGHDGDDNLWQSYLDVQSVYPHFAMERITGAADIYPVFRDLFKKQTT